MQNEVVGHDTELSPPEESIAFGADHVFPLKKSALPE